MTNPKVKYNIKKDPNYRYNRLTLFGKFFYYTKAARFYYDGDGLGFIWNWWNPISWICLPVFFIVHILFTGIPETFKYKHDLGIGMNPHFKQYPEHLEWMK